MSGRKPGRPPKKNKGGNPPRRQGRQASPASPTPPRRLRNRDVGRIALPAPPPALNPVVRLPQVPVQIPAVQMAHVPPPAAAAAPPVAPAVVPAPYVNYRLPLFIENNVKSWLSLVEFSLAGVDAYSKYTAVLRTLPAHVAVELSDVVDRHNADPNPDWAAHFVEFKALLAARYSDSDRAAIKKLLASAQRGDRKPTAFLRFLRAQVAGRAIDCEVFIKDRFISSLPISVRTSLMTRDDEPLDTLATLADAMCEVAYDGCAVMMATAAPQAPVMAVQSNLEQQVATLLTCVQALTAKVGQLEDEKIQTRSRSRERERDTSRQREPRDRSASQPPDVCWYHHKFGPKASKCRQPCIWVSQNGGVSTTTTVANVLAAPAPTMVSLADLKDVLSQMSIMPAANNSATHGANGNTGN